MSAKGSRALTEAEVRSTLRLLETPRNRALFGTLLYTGPRISEALALDLPDVRAPGPELRIRSSITYRKRITKGQIGSRALDVHPDLSALLHAYLLTDGRTEGPLFPAMPARFHVPDLTTDRRLDRQSAWKILAHAFRAQHLERCSPHSLRKTFAQRLYDGGTDVYTIMHLMGHSKIQTTLEYLELRDDKLSRAIASLPSVDLDDSVTPPAPAISCDETIELDP